MAVAAAGYIICCSRVIDSIAPEVSTMQRPSKLALACDRDFAGKIAAMKVKYIIYTALAATVHNGRARSLGDFQD